MRLETKRSQQVQPIRTGCSIPSADSLKVKGVITWVGVNEGVSAEVRLYNLLFSEEMPDAGGKDFIEVLNPESLKVVTACVEPALAQDCADENFQFERHGYFVADRVDHAAGGVRPVFDTSRHAQVMFS